MGEALGGHPKSLILAWILNDPRRRAALSYDFRSRLRLPLRLITTRRMRWAEAWDYTSELLRDHTSHTYAAVHEWAYVPAAAEVAGLDLIEMWANAKRPRNTIAVRIPRPWTQVDRTHEEGPSTPDPQRAERRALLDASTARDVPAPI